MSRVTRGAKTVASRVTHAAHHRAENTLDFLRWGDRVVLRTPPAGLRIGNLLYVWLNAHRRTTQCESVRALESRAMKPWLNEFPRLNELTVVPSNVRFSDRREWDATWLYQRFGVDFDRTQLRAFIQNIFADRVAGGSEERLVVNVRRGDFYGTEFEAKHGFDVIGYTTAALERFPAERGVLVVSDDPEWCRRHLGQQLRSRFGDVEYAAPDPLQNLLALASARRLIGANSTFSYWGAYMADALHADAEIVMPRFHARMAHGTEAYQIDPRWTALDGFY